MSERKAVKLNKLESFLLKLVIPFIRIAHCPRGPYLKVKGDLILISADLSQSLSKILPLEQSLVPVAFKRRLAYGGSYLEEIIEKEKVIQYFSWLKRYNHLYKDFNLNPDLIEEFKVGALERAEDFEQNTKERTDDIPTSSDEESLSDKLSEEENDLFQRFSIDEHQPPDNSRKQDYTSMFFNKYCENINLPTVSNRFADIVVDFESSRNTVIDEEDDFDAEDKDLDDEPDDQDKNEKDKLDNSDFENEPNNKGIRKPTNQEGDKNKEDETRKDKNYETFLSNIGEQCNLENEYAAFVKDLPDRNSYFQKNAKDTLEESLPCLSQKDKFINDEFWTGLDILTSPTEEQAEILSNSAQEHAKNM